MNIIKIVTLDELLHSDFEAKDTTKLWKIHRAYRINKNINHKKICQTIFGQKGRKM